MTIGQRVRDILLYVTIAIAIVGAIAIYAVYSGRTNGPSTLPLDWLTLAAFTLLVFGNTLRAFWRPQSIRFWVSWNFGLLLHLAVSIPLVAAFHPVPIVWLLLVCIGEQVVLSKVMSQVMRARQSCMECASGVLD